MMRVRFLAFFSVFGFSGWLSSAAAQTAPSSHALASRAELEAQLRVADSLHHTAESFNLRRRLTDGDFEVGDRVLLILDTDGQTTGVAGLRARDTVSVQANRVIGMPAPIGDIDLSGVLFSELTPVLSTRIGKYYRNITVRATPLIRLSIAGAVGRPGFYYVPTDSPISDLIMLSGGQSASADLGRTEIRRGNTVLWKGADVRAAIASGMTAAALGLHTGDELAVGERKQMNWVPIVQVGATVISVLLTVLTLSK